MRCCISTTNEHIRKIVFCVSLVIVVWVGVVKVTLWWERLPTICKNYIVVVIITIIYNYFLYQKHNKLLSYLFLILTRWTKYEEILHYIFIPHTNKSHSTNFFTQQKYFLIHYHCFFVNAFNNWSTYTCSNTI